jgi:hypothetical protein
MRTIFICDYASTSSEKLNRALPVDKQSIAEASAVLVASRSLAVILSGAIATPPINVPGALCCPASGRNDYTFGRTVPTDDPTLLLSAAYEFEKLFAGLLPRVSDIKRAQLLTIEMPKRLTLAPASQDIVTPLWG